MDADLLIIGAGPGGYETALLAAERGKKVILVNGGQLGGTCLNAGCIPTKCMVKDAAVVSMCRDHEDFGVTDVRFEVDFNRVIARRAAVVGQLREGIAGLLKKAGVTVAEGKAVFKNANTVTVGEEEYSARDIIIANGSE